MYDYRCIAQTLHDRSKPIYKTVAEGLRKAILEGALEQGMRLPSEEGLASELGINHLTLRKSLKILADMKLIVQCQGRGTFVSYRHEDYLRIGVVISSSSYIPDDIYLMRLLAGLNHALCTDYQGALIILSAAPDNFSTLLKRINQSQCDALVVLETQSLVTDYLKRHCFDQLPIVFINALNSECLSDGQFIVKTSSDIIARAVGHLYELGHRAIGFVQACDYSSYAEDHALLDRELAFRASCSMFGITQRYIRKAHGSWFDTTHQLVSDLFRGTDRPTALLLPGYVYSCGAWQALIQLGFSIPEEVSFIGFDGRRGVNPHMSSMVQPLEQMAVKAIELIVASRNQGKHLTQHVYEIPADYVERGSCARLPV